MCKLSLKHYETTLLVSKSSIIFEGLSILRSKRLLTFSYWLCLSAAHLSFSSVICTTTTWVKETRTNVSVDATPWSIFSLFHHNSRLYTFTTSTTIMQQCLYTASNVSKYSAKSPTIRRILFEIQLRATRVTLHHWNWDGNSQDRRCHLCVYLQHQQQRANMYNKSIYIV